MKTASWPADGGKFLSKLRVACRAWIDDVEFRVLGDHACMQSIQHRRCNRQICMGAPEGVALEELGLVLPVPLGDEQRVVVPVHVDGRVLLLVLVLC